MGNFSGNPNIYREFAILPIEKRLILPSQRLSFFDVLNHVSKPDKDPRQPHDSIDDLVAEAYIATAIFDETILPVLTDILSARRATHGPEKDVNRVKVKVAQKAGINQDNLDSYLSSGNIHFGLNCDYSRDMQPVGTMKFIHRATDMFQGRGRLTIDKGDGTKPLDVYVLDVENGFVEEVSHKPNLMRINLKLGIPIQLKDGTESFHIIEHKILLKKSIQNEFEGCRAYTKFRNLKKLEAQAFEALSRVEEGSSPWFSLCDKWLDAADSAKSAGKERNTINAKDHTIPGIHQLIGYKPEEKTGSVRGYSWTFTPIEELVAEMKKVKHNTLSFVTTERTPGIV